MSKKPMKISRDQINKIRTLTREGKTIAQICSETKVASHIVRYHFERAKLSQLEELRGHKALEGEITPTPTGSGEEYFKKLIDELMARNKKLVDYISYH
jgi:Helix-turn-helix domain of resolvase